MNKKETAEKLLEFGRTLGTDEELEKGLRFAWHKLKVAKKA